MTGFGSRMQLVAISFQGELNKRQCVLVTEDLIEALGMNSGPESMFCDYPYKGKGGVGFTYFQPITESFMTWDVWSDLKGGYLLICSCKLFWVVDVVKVLENVGLKPIQVKTEGFSFDVAVL